MEMGIKALSLTAIERYVSPLDAGYQAVCTNQAELDSWDASKAKSKGERPTPKRKHDENATVFLLGTLSSLVMSMLADDVASFRDEGAMTIRLADTDVMAARLGIRGWENFFDDAGNPVVFETESVVIRGRKFDIVAEDLAARIPIPVLRGIGQHVKQQNSIDSVTAKNSD
jgi:hypothetical protein